MLFFNRLRPDQVLSFFLALLFLLIQGGLTLPDTTWADQEPVYINLIKPAPQPILPAEVTQLADENFNPEDSPLLQPLSTITAQSYVVLDVGSSAVLLEKNLEIEEY